MKGRRLEFRVNQKFVSPQSQRPLPSSSPNEYTGEYAAADNSESDHGAENREGQFNGVVLYTCGMRTL